MDTDVIDWLKSKGKGYQTRMNAMLRELMRSEKEQRGRRGRP
ncbi:MAG: BrnA antitoxin family protein [Truepera sp.]|nr:BrnA antitoxin family protein [Truepera sp.]